MRVFGRVLTVVLEALSHHMATNEDNYKQDAHCNPHHPPQPHFCYRESRMGARACERFKEYSGRSRKGLPSNASDVVRCSPGSSSPHMMILRNPADVSTDCTWSSSHAFYKGRTHSKME